MLNKMSKDRFPVKGFNEGLLITLDDRDWQGVVETIVFQIEERVDFFKGAKLAMEVDERNIRAAELGELRDKLSGMGVTLFAVFGNNKSTLAVAESLGLTTNRTALKEKSGLISQKLYGGEPAILIKKTLRSGASVKFNGHVIVEGDVNPGSEIIASGSIFIWGRLRGSVHAGVSGGEDQVVCALDFSPIKLRIAEIEREEIKLRLLKKKRNTVKAFIQNNQIKIDEWNY